MQERLRVGASLLGTLQQDGFHLLWMGHQVVVALAQGGNFAIHTFKQHGLGIAPGNAITVGLAQCRGFLIAGKGLVDLEEC
ncbi:hypothetical protein D3C71_1920410 [compost metagenome]